MTVQAAPIRLADLAEEMRPDWDRAQFDGVLAAARGAGWSWHRTFKLVSQLLLDESATPRDLAVAIRDPLRPGPAPADSADVGEWEQMRQAIVPRQRADGPS
jgi:hypothetical protein